LHLTAIEAFCKTLDSAKKSQSADAAFIIYTGSDDALALMHACLQVGAYLVLRRELELDIVLRALTTQNDCLAALEASGHQDRHAVSVGDCLGALDHARHLGWLVGPSSDAEPLLDAEEIAHWCGGFRQAAGVSIATLEGTMRADWDDWIIQGVQGEFYPCKPDIFDATYEAVPEK
jgi:hypothetical protein